MRLSYFLPMALALIWCPMSASAAFVPDEFDGPTTGTQWTYHDSTPAGTTATVVNGHLEIHAAEGSDHWFLFDSYGYLEQDAPAGTNWEVITKMDDFDPRVAGQQRKFIRAGMQLWQDNNHFITLSTLSSADGLFVDSQNLWQFDPVDPNVNGGDSAMLRGATQLNGFPGDLTSIWYKLQSTPRGYRGYISSNGTDWLECLNIVKNPETPDGLLVNPKIRLFEAGGFFHDGGNAETQKVTPAKFDFIHMNTIPDLTEPYADDDFEAGSLASNWEFHAGIGVGTIGFNAGDLILTGGIYSNMWFDIQQPTYIYQDAPTSASYALTMKGSPLVMDQIPFELFNSYGIWLWKDQSNFIFISNQRGDQPPPTEGPWTPNNRMEAGAKFNNQYVTNTIGFTNASDPAPAYLRVVRDNSIVRVEYSFDNVTWTPFDFDPGTPVVTDFPIGSDNMQVRLFTKRVFGGTEDNDGDSSPNPPYDAHFEWLTSETIVSDVSDWALY